MEGEERAGNRGSNGVEGKDVKGYDGMGRGREAGLGYLSRRPPRTEFLVTPLDIVNVCSVH